MRPSQPVMLAELESISEVVTAEIPDAFHSIELHVRPPVHEVRTFCVARCELGLAHFSS